MVGLWPQRSFPTKTSFTFRSPCSEASSMNSCLEGNWCSMGLHQDPRASSRARSSCGLCGTWGTLILCSGICIPPAVCRVGPGLLSKGSEIHLWGSSHVFSCPLQVWVLFLCFSLSIQKAHLVHLYLPLILRNESWVLSEGEEIFRSLDALSPLS